MKGCTGLNRGAGGPVDADPRSTGPKQTGPKPPEAAAFRQDLPVRPDIHFFRFSANAD